MRVACALVIGLSVGCASTSIPDPKEATREYAEAAARGDGERIYDMMTSEARKARSRDDVKKMVADEKAELTDQAKAVTAPGTRVQATARLRFDDGEETALELHDGRFWVTAAGALPGGAHTPEAALDQLRRVLARRSYAGLLRVLTPRTRAMIEQDLRGLVDGLDNPDSLAVHVTGDTATVNVPGGHHVRLKREGGVWRADDFD
ncbi:MAG TPA: hypothetical protein VLM85_16800 [Polyangiaceae bacterium]|nr:hypothetical protein [Polyangiaceae bacterium]